MEKITRPQWLVVVMFHGKYSDEVFTFDTEEEARIEFNEWVIYKSTSLVYLAQVTICIAKEKPC